MTTQLFRTTALTTIIAIAAGIAQPAMAQQAVEQNPDLPELSEQQQQSRADHLVFSVGAGGLYQFETNLDEGGDYNVYRLGTGIASRFTFDEDTRLNLNLTYTYSDYDFDGSQNFAAADPWDEVHTLRLGAVYSVDTSNEWTLFGGPIFELSFEGGAETSDSMNAGGLIGARYRFSEDLSVSLGGAVLTQIEDDVRFFPIIGVEWQITDRLSLTSRGATSGFGLPSGLELICDQGNGWVAALGGSYMFNRFRLADDSTAASEGVGEESGLPLWLRLGYTPNSRFNLDFIGGVVLNGELELEDDGGDELFDTDFDPAPYVAVVGSIRF